MKKQMQMQADRLSILPDDVLLHILSLVPGSKRKAQTSILSKRWRNLWAHDPNISILMEQDSVYEVQAMEYIDTVDQCLRACRAPALQTLELNLYSPYYRFGLCPFANAASRWIRFAGSRSVRLLRLVGLTPGSHVGGGPKLPRSIFNCGQSLCEMDIILCTFTIDIPSYFQSQAFHRLRKLHLTSTSIADQTLGNFLSKCPALEDLRLLHCQELTQLHLALPNLTKLIVSGCLALVRAAIDAPKLRYIFFAGNLSRLSLKKPPLLHHVGLLNGRNRASFGHWRRLLSAVSHAEDLWVNDWLFKFLVKKKNHAGPDAMFNNLKQLRCDVKWITKPVLQALCSILTESPSLEELYIDLCHGNRGKVRTSLSIPFRYRYPSASGLRQELYELVQMDFEIDYLNNMLDLSDPLEGYEKPLKCLKTARFLEFIGSANEFRLVEFILGNSISLETLTVLNFLRCPQEAYSKAFDTFCKASQHVQISQSNTDTGNRFYQECKIYILSNV